MSSLLFHAIDSTWTWASTLASFVDIANHYCDAVLCKATKTKKAKRALPKPPPSQPKRPAVKARPATALDEFEMLEAMAGRESVSTPMLVSRPGTAAADYPPLSIMTGNHPASR